jgi:hypothetical protein
VDCSVIDNAVPASTSRKIAKSSRLDLENLPGADAGLIVKITLRICLQRYETMTKAVTWILLTVVGCSTALSADRPTRFWNLTYHTISEFYLAPAGTNSWGDNQCKNDRDGTVDSDERLRITNTSPGLYDARIKDVTGRVCLVRNIRVEAGETFSIEEKDLTSCDR